MRLPLILLLLVGVAAPQSEPPVTLAIRGGRLIDGYGGKPIENSVILVAGDRIAAVGTAADVTVPAGVPVVSSEGMTVMPGLIDMHVHFLVLGHNDYGFWFPYARQRSRELMELSARMILDQGVTTVKDCSGPLPEIVQLRDRIARGDTAGPRAIVTGPFLQASTNPNIDDLYWSVSSVEEAVARLEQLLAAGVDQIKTAQSARLGQPIVDAIVDGAHRAGKHVTAHVGSEADMQVLLAAGVDSGDTFEHVGMGSRPAYSQDLIDKLHATGVGLVPTAIALEGVLQLERFPEFADIQSLKRDLPAELYQLVHGSYLDIQRHPLFALKDNLPQRDSKLRQLHQAGLRLLMGTDSGTRGNPHQLAAWREMEILTRYGMTAAEVIRAATYHNARNLGMLTDVGTIAPGKIADIIVIDGDPLHNIRDMRWVRHVIKDGKVHR